MCPPLDRNSAKAALSRSSCVLSHSAVRQGRERRLVANSSSSARDTRHPLDRGVRQHQCTSHVYSNQAAQMWAISSGLNGHFAFLLALHGTHAGRAFEGQLLPPLDSGFTWSVTVALPPQIQQRPP
ncbi:hypothetical protein RHRU231_450207 [Rhodococcus ruber]|uniref:Uncharacterized protein n=1 Tax=Rhodococcus ruber TaxID=1830 RepID=A0A098BLC0_9NOCA|nr:hypothetical protein RHRU231_450207 [Rhodococcus ruber]